MKPSAGSIGTFKTFKAIKNGTAANIATTTSIIRDDFEVVTQMKVTMTPDGAVHCDKLFSLLINYLSLCSFELCHVRIGNYIRESSFNMTSGGRDEDMEGKLQKFLPTRKGDSENIRGGGLQKFVNFKPKRRGGY